MTGIYTTRTFYKLEKEKKKKTLENEIIIFFFLHSLVYRHPQTENKKKMAGSEWKGRSGLGRLRLNPQTN